MTESNLKNKPLGEWTLAEAKENCEKIGNTCNGCSFYFHPECVLSDLPACWSFPEKSPLTETKLTEAELTICKAIKAKWVSRGIYDCYIRLWEDRPVHTGGEYKGKRLLGLFTEDCFHSIRPGDLVCVEERQNE